VPQVIGVVHDPLHLTLGQSRGHTGREHRHCDHRSDHPADRDETARQRRRRLFARAGLRHRGRGPPDAGAQASRTAAEMFGLAPFQQPDQKSHAHCEAEQDRYRLQKAERKEGTEDGPPARFAGRYRDAKARGVIGQGEIHGPLALRRDGDRGDPGIERALDHPIQDLLICLLFRKPVAHMQALGDAMPESDADAMPAPVLPLHHERGYFPGCDHQFSIGQGGVGRSRRLRPRGEASQRERQQNDNSLQPVHPHRVLSAS